MNKNIDFWEKIIQSPSAAYKELFYKEDEYLHKHINKNSKVLDIGCGDGRSILSILDITQNITGIDNDPKAIEDARVRLKDYPTVVFAEADAKNMPFSDKSFDCAVLMMTLVNFADGKEKALAEMKRVIKDNGKIIISVYSDKALEERLSMYKVVGVPIKEVSAGYVTFDESVGAHTSEQFSKEQLEKMVEKVGLKMVDCEGIRNLAYICTLQK